jgi:hypothetical protein
MRGWYRSFFANYDQRLRILCLSCFAACKSLSSISFETSSELVRIEDGAFTEINLDRVVVPRNVSFIAAKAFPCHCSLALADESELEDDASTIGH